MTYSQHRNWLMTSISLGSSLLLGMTSCSSDEPGLTLSNAGSDTSGGSSGSTGEGGSSAGTDEGTAGANETAGSAGKGSSSGGSGGKAAGKGGNSGSHSNAGSDAGRNEAGSPSDDAGQGGGSGTGASGAGATGGTGGSGGAFGGAGNGGTSEGGAGGTPDEEPESLCLFHSAPAPVSGGEGGAPSAPRGVEVGTNAFVGPYLTDLAGFTLYIYGADVPGDCNNAPVTNCTADCAIAWPPFDAGERTLDATLDDAVFGTIDRGDGTFQTTYYGWPLYYYKSDTAVNTINGQGKGKTWYSAEVALPNLMIMRGPVATGGIKYLSDDHGHTLYALSGDTLGSSGDDPVSSCTGDCLAQFLPYAPGAVYPVTTIEPHDVALFFRDDGGLQTAYKGAPLYYSKLDVRAGEQNGVGVLGGALVLP